MARRGNIPHDHARSRAFRWNEDGIAGICDRHQRICFALALYNGHDPILKERMFGLAGNEGNHGEDVKECYFYLDSTPTHSFMRYLYKYPHRAFPYEELVRETARRSRAEREYDLLDTGIFDEDRYFDVFVEYAKAGVEDILVRITAHNRGSEPAELHLLPTIWFRNTWSWGGDVHRPHMQGQCDPEGRVTRICLEEPTYGARFLYFEPGAEVLFTENETNNARLFGTDNASPSAKDGINDAIVGKRTDTVNLTPQGTKAAIGHRRVIGGGASFEMRLRLSERDLSQVEAFEGFDRVFAERQREADEFYADVTPENLSDDARNVMRQAFAGLLWSKQFYHYAVRDWMRGDEASAPPPAERLSGRNRDWGHLYNADILSMPDKWEYPWYAAWDLAFHCLPIALVDAEFAKEQLLLLLREWYMHPNGQIPAYEWAFGDVNPPVHAWAALRVYKIEKKRRGVGDRNFLERIFHKLMLNFTWWVNRKDEKGRNVFQGGFLGLDNIGIFDRSAPLPTGGFIEQSDGTSWMAMYCLNMLAIALELASESSVYEDVASKFWEHFVYIAHALNTLGLWDEEDGLYYDVLHTPDGRHRALKVRSMVGLIPLFAVETLEGELLEKLPAFGRRFRWFLENRPDLVDDCADMNAKGQGGRRLLAVADEKKLRRVLAVMLDESEFLSPYGIRGLSRVHATRPYRLLVDGKEHRVDYEPAESKSGLFGGNSNWRGPVWFPVNYLMVEALQKFHHFFGDGFKVEFPTGSGVYATLAEVAAELSRRLTRIFLRDASGRRPAFGDESRFQTDPHFKDLLWFHEYFHGDDGTGIGASHQTGWTGLVAKLLQQSGE
ncbi:MAG TPA: glucosidase [Polyangiaceae bacterium]|nr:glucosidase [Polyangiaceae bacterium]